MKPRAHVAGSGMISAIGTSISATWTALQTSASGIGTLTLFDSIHRNVLPVGEVNLSNTVLSAHLVVSPDLPRAVLLGIHAVRAAVGNSKIDIKKWRTGLISATTVGGMDKTEHFFTEFATDPKRGRLRETVHHGCGKAAAIIAHDLGITHFVSTINTACSSSANAIALGSRMIAAGLLDVAIAGGTDALTKFTLNGFNSLMILDADLCRPFDAARKGLNLGEGAGYVVLASDQVVKNEGLSPKSRVSGYANTNDAFHQTASSPDGRGSFAAMQMALAISGIKTADIDYINLHGTGTANNDLSESTAILRLFGRDHPPLSSTKSFTGHTLGASGGIEAVVSLLAIENQCLFPNLRFANPIIETGLMPQTIFENAEVNHVMSNSFGFGGNCSALVFSKN